MSFSDLDSSDGIQSVNISSVTAGADEAATYVVTARNAAVATNKSMLSLLNASGSGLIVKIRQLFLINTQTTAVTGAIADFSLLRITGHSSGTALTAGAFDTADSLSGTITARTGSTVAGEGTLAYLRAQWSSDEWGVGALDVEGSDHKNQVGLNLLRQEKGCKPFTLRAGEGFTVKQTNTVTTGQFDVVAIFTVESA